MIKKIAVVAWLLVWVQVSAAQLQSPEQFLGYRIGTRFTPHWQIVNYFRHVAAAVPASISLQQYGETTERRPLLLAFISSAENIRRLDEIRRNNLKLAGMDGSSPAGNKPAIVWLSYNV